MRFLDFKNFGFFDPETDLCREDSWRTITGFRSYFCFGKKKAGI
jgi:hypothetical protein